EVDVHLRIAHATDQRLALQDVDNQAVAEQVRRHHDRTVAVVVREDVTATRATEAAADARDHRGRLRGAAETDYPNHHGRSRREHTQYTLHSETPFSFVKAPDAHHRHRCG